MKSAQARAQDSSPLSRAIASMRAELDKRWTVTELARRIGMSRPVFARKFRERTGESPQRFLTRLRMQRAAELLVHSELTLAEVAGHVGYCSEFAFNRAFKRHAQLAPGAFRRRARRAAFGQAPSMRCAA